MRNSARNSDVTGAPTEDNRREHALFRQVEGSLALTALAFRL